MKKYICILSSILVFTLMSCNYNGRREISVSDGWKMTLSDNEAYSKPDFDDSSWTIYTAGKNIKTAKTKSFLWFRKTISVPEDFFYDDLWIGMEAFNGAADFYADGIYIGSKGSLPPNENVRTENLKMVKIPANCFHDKQTVIAIKIYAPQTQLTGIKINLGNKIQADYVNDFRTIFSQQLFSCMAFLCLFIGFYCFAQFLVDRKSVYFLFYAFSVLFVAVYFFDLGSNNLVLEYNLQRSIVRPCLPISVNFVFLYLLDFFKSKKFKPLSIITGVVDVVFMLAYQFVKGKGAETDLLFMISLIDVFSVVIYGMVITVKGLKKKVQGSLPVFIGFVLASLLAAFDIICMVINVQPFMWLQGIAFFVLDMAIFVTITIKSASVNRTMQTLAVESSGQRDKLEVIFDNTKKISAETTEIVHSLNTSVKAVNTASTNSSAKVAVINNAIEKQTAIRNEVADAIETFAVSVADMSQELEKEVVSIKETVEDTNEIVAGIQSVGNGIRTAASFANSLLDQTKTGTKDMKQLAETMAQVQESSKEILQVASALEEFAGQTDLLAMNASIEAAHAGESGKGFAVIAHEIKKLAAQSSQRSSKIGEIVQSISHSVQASVTLSTKVAQALKDIQSGAIKSAEETSRAANEMDTQQASCQRISKEASLLTANSSHVQEEAKKQALFSENLKKSMSELQMASKDVEDANRDISSGAMELEQQSRSLMEIVEKTKITSTKLEELMKD